MQPQELDSVLDNVESLHRIATALARDSGDLARVLKQIQTRAAAPSEKADIHAYNEQLQRTLPHYGIPDNLRESLHETLLTQYAQLHAIQPTDLAALLSQYRKPGTEIIMDQAVQVDGPTPSALSTSTNQLLAATEAMARRAALPKQPGELVAQYFSPAVLGAGRGFLKPGVGGLESYSEDILKIGVARSMKWPSGWYSQPSASQRPDQFFLKTDNFAFVVRGLNTDAPEGFATPLASDNGEFVQLNFLSRGEGLALSAELEKAFEDLSKA